MARLQQAGCFVLVLIANFVSYQGGQVSAQSFGSGTIQQVLFNYMQQMGGANPTTQAQQVQPAPVSNNQVTTQPPSVTQSVVTFPSNNVATPGPTQPPLPPAQPQYPRPNPFPLPVNTGQNQTPPPPVQATTLPAYGDIFLPPTTAAPRPPPAPGSIPFVPAGWGAQPRPTANPTQNPWTHNNAVPPPPPAGEQVQQPLDIAKTFIPPQIQQTAQRVGQQMGITGYFESHGCVDPRTHMPRGTTTQGLVLGCAAPQSKQLCMVAGRQAMGEAAGAGGNMALMAMFQPPHFKKTMEKCLSPTIMNKITMQQLSGGAGGMDPTMMMLMMGGGRGGGAGANPLITMLTMNMMNRRRSSAASGTQGGMNSGLSGANQMRNSQRTPGTGQTSTLSMNSMFGGGSNAQSQTMASLSAGAALPSGGGLQPRGPLDVGGGTQRQSMSLSPAAQSSGTSTTSLTTLFSSILGGQQSSGSTRVKRQTGGLAAMFSSWMGGNQNTQSQSPGALPFGAAQPTSSGTSSNSMFGMNSGAQAPSGALPVGAAQPSGTPSSQGGLSPMGSMSGSSSPNTGHQTNHGPSPLLPNGAAAPSGQSSTQGQSTSVKNIVQECMAFLPMMMGGEGGFNSPEAQEHIMDMRKQMLPYECTEVGLLPFRMCCPGQVGRPSMMDLMMSNTGGA